LSACGHRFQSDSDTEVLLRAFLEWDTDCFQRLKGMFAAAFWEEDKGRLVLVRDRLGIKPLYFSLQQGNLYFGSELKVLLAHPEISRTLDLGALDQYLSLNYVPCPRSLIKGIEKLPPGHVLEWRAGNADIWPFWQLTLNPCPDLGEEEALVQLDGLLSQSIRQHLISDVPLGILLSGGIDSSTIVHYAASHCPTQLKTFSVSFSGRSFDEGKYFRGVANLYGTDHHEFDLSRDLNLADTICQFSEYADEPCGDSSSLPVWYLSKLCRQQVTVTLSGEGADELFGGYLTYQADRLARWARLVPEKLRETSLAFVRRLVPVSDEKIGLEYMLKRFLEGTLLPPLQGHYYWNGVFSNSQKEALLTYERQPEWEIEALYDKARGEGELNRFLWFDQQYYLPDDILAKVDRMSMAHSLEVRPPFLDHEIVEFAARLPERLKIRGRKQKYILKRLMEGKLPQEVLTRKKMGFDIPAHDWLRRELRPLLLDTLNSSALNRIGLFRPGVLEKWMNDHLEGRINIGFHLWGLLVLFLWMEKWQIQPPGTETQLSSEVLLAKSSY
ncbi:MAG TPA: asparagine synthase (glutamine-hydrolyzing), partial [Terriglobia bacterium]|nr:asparagine synthase (glutamine-hydrolyzing) [Terriglobia bacterium]